MMDCLHSMAPNDEELLGYVLDAQPLSREAKAHLEQCSVCQQRLARYKQTNMLLLAKLYRSQCPGVEELHHYCAHMLPTDDMISIAMHVKHCPLCTTEVADIRHVLASFEPFPMNENAYHPLKTVLPRIIASFVPLRLQLATRSEVSATTWPRQYRAQALDLSLHLSRASNGEIMLLGLFTSNHPDESVDIFEGRIVELYRAPGPPLEQDEAYPREERIRTPLMSTYVDDLGNIVFKAVPVGDYVMVVCLPESEVVIEGLVIENG